MASLAKIFGGILLIVAGIAIIYVSNIYHLIEIFNYLGIIIVIIGAYLFILSFLEKSSNKTKHTKNLNKGAAEVKKLTSGLESKNNSLTKDTGTGKKGNVPSLGSNFTESKLGSLDTKKIANKVKDVSKSADPKNILQPMFPKSNENIKKLKFTPNYEKPMKVTRKPQKRNKSQLANVTNGNKLTDNQNSGIDSIVNHLNNLPGEKSERIARALASDDFIEPIHNRGKTTPTSSTTPNTNPSKLSQDSRNKQNISNASIFDDDDDSRDFTTDDFEDENYNANHELGSSSSGYDPSKFLNSYVVCTKGTMTSKEAFDELAKSAKSEITIEMPSIKDMTDEFLSKISSLDVRIIIQEFDIKDMAYILLITSFLEQGVKIRTLPIIHTINLVADDSHALIISENDSQDDLDIGAVYNDAKSISNVKSMFEQSWNMANDLNVNNVSKGFD